MSDFRIIMNNLSSARAAQNLSQQELAGKLGMKQSQISEIEAGKRDVRLRTLIEIARGVGLEVVLIPRTLIPAINYIIQQNSSQTGNQKSKYEDWNEDDDR